MNSPALTAEDVMSWNDRTFQEWRDLLTAHPEVLTLPCDIAGVKTAGELLQHIVAVELRYAERLAGLPPTDYTAIPYDSADSLYATHERAAMLYRQQLATDVDWEEQIEFVTRSLGPARSSRRAVFFHAHLHGIRHYAQLATLVRHHGIGKSWTMDYLAMHLKPF